MKTYSEPFRRVLFLAVVASAPGMMSCSHTEVVTPISVTPVSLTLSVTAAVEEGSRTVLAEDGQTIQWKSTDELSVFSGGVHACFSCQETTEEGSATFAGTLPLGWEEDGLVGLYPYDKGAGCSGGLVTATLPSVQEAVAGSFPDGVFLSAGFSKTQNITFYNLCSGVKFSLDRSDVSSVTFRSNAGEPIAGTFRFSLDDKTGFPVMQDVADGIAQVTLTAPDGGCFEAGTWYYLVTLPAVLSEGFTLTLTGADMSASRRSAKALSLNRSHFRKAALSSEDADVLSTDIENSRVRAYLDETDYSDDLVDYKNSTVKSYTTGITAHDYSWSRPAPVTFTWATKEARTLTIASDEGFTQDVQSFSTGASDATTQVYNLIPGQTYWWKTTSGSTVLNESFFIPYGPLRMIKGTTIPNIRDLGGWKAGDKTTAYGKLYRGYQMNESSGTVYTQDKDLILNTLGATIDVDLRYYKEKSQTNTQAFTELPHYNWIVKGYLYDSSANPSTGATSDLYQDCIRNIIGWLSKGEVVYFHCVEGADRTGTLAFLIEALLGVSESDLSKDYELTSFYSSARSTPKYRERNSTSYRFPDMITYLKTFSGTTMQDKVTAWAKTRRSASVNPLTDAEIQTLKDLMLTEP